MMCFFFLCTKPFTLKAKTLLALGINPFRLDKTTFQKGLSVREGKPVNSNSCRYCKYDENCVQHPHSRKQLDLTV